MDWNEIRDQFPAAKKIVCLNAAQRPPVSKLAAAEGKKYYDDLLDCGNVTLEELNAKKEQTRKNVAEFINANKEEIAFTVNTSHGMNIIADVLKGCGDVVKMMDEFPSSTIPWLYRKYNVAFVEPEKSRYPIELIEKSVNEKTKIVVTSHVQSGTGFKQDLSELGKLCKKRGLIFVVNATQSAGAMPIDVKESNIDFLVFAGYKWMMAGHGIGVLYVNSKWFGKISYPAAGWLSVENAYAMDNKNIAVKKDASEIELGVPQYPNIFALSGAISMLNKIGIENVEKRIYELEDYLLEKTRAMNLEIISPSERKNRSGITVFLIRNAKDIAQKLRERGVIVSARGEGLRVSLHVYNNEDDVDRFVDEMKKIMKI